MLLFFIDFMPVPPCEKPGVLLAGTCAPRPEIKSLMFLSSHVLWNRFCFQAGVFDHSPFKLSSVTIPHGGLHICSF